MLLLLVGWFFVCVSADTGAQRDTQRDLAPGQPQRSGNCKRRFVTSQVKATFDGRDACHFVFTRRRIGGRGVWEGRGGGGGQVNELPRQKLDGQDSCQRSEGLQADK